MKFPIIEIFGENSLVQVTKPEFQKFRGRLIKPNKFHMKGAARKQYRTTAIIDYEGTYYDVIPGKLHHAWLAGFAKVWDLTSMDCKLTEGRTLTVGELQQMAKAWKNQYARLFRKFLVSQEPNAIFDSTMFRKAWEHSYIKIPEKEWGEDAF